MRFEKELWRMKRGKRKDELKSLIDLFLYPFDLIYDILDCWRLR